METGGTERSKETHQSKTQPEETAFGRGSATGTCQTTPPISSSSNDTLRIIYTNARSLNNKVHELEVIAYENDADIILVSETWCNKDIPNTLLDIPGYFIDPDLRSDRLDTINGIGGGLIIYCKIL